MRANNFLHFRLKKIRLLPMETGSDKGGNGKFCRPLK